MELATGAMGSLLLKLGELVKEEYGLQKGVKKKIEKLSRELQAAHTVLTKIGDVPADQLDKQVKLWASEVREASYDMEDVIDTFLVRVEDDPNEPAEPHMLRRLRKKVGRLFKKIKARHKISSLIDDISKKLEEVAARRGRYKLDGSVAKPVAANTIDPRILNLYKRATELVGIERPRDELINMLSLGDDVDSSDNMKIISIVGFGGLGKTTLAKAVYDHFKPHFNRRASVVRVDHLHNPDMNKDNHDQLKPHFEYGAFVAVGRNPDMKKVFRDILNGLDEEKYSNFELKELDEKQLMDKLNDFAKGNRCLIVIDDIWDKGTWELVRRALQESNCQSRLVITTRINEVATQVGQSYKMQPLSHGTSKKLLHARIVDSERKYFRSPSTEACEKILKKCGGVPLAIITIASLLVGKPEEDWSEVYNSIGFGLKGNDDVYNMRRILSFSYYDLPSHLKACLLYLSVFREDRIIEKNSLIWMWIAEGFISEEQAAAEGVGLFEIGESCFNELINRNMIEPRERGYEGYVNACSVHDMVLDLIHQLSSEENFVTVLNGGGRQKLQGGISRRLTLQCIEEHNVGHQADIIAVEKVRSVFAGQCDFCTLCPHLPFLRVLEMVGCSVSEECGKDVSYHLGSLIYLRYLSLASFSITELPREVRYLRFLRTLDLQTSRIKELPKEVGHLTQLVCLRAGDWATTVPAGLIGKLTSLQELCIWCKGEDAIMQFVEELGRLKELRVLWTKIHVTSESLQRCLLESIGNLHNIKELRIEGSSLGNDDKNDASGLVSCRHLRFLHSECFVFSGLTAWIKSWLAPNLSYLEVKVVAVGEQDMEALAKLPELSSLILHSNSDTNSVVSIKIGIEGAAYFRKLRLLKILGSFIRFVLCSSEYSSSSSREPSNNTTMPSLESLEFAVLARSLKDENLHLGFGKLLGFQNLGTSSLQRITANVNCRGARIWEVEEAEFAMRRAARAHPKHPTLLTNWVEPQDTISRYQKACLEMSRDPGLVIKPWNLGDIVGPGQILILRMPDPEASSSKVMRLLYTDSGTLLALSSNAVHKLWKYESSTSIPPILWQPENGIPMTNDTTDGNDPEEAAACTALTGNDYYLISASGGKVSLFNIRTFKVMTTFMAPPPAATFLAFYPPDSNIIAIGMEDASIQIYNVRTDDVKIVLMGHQKKVTGLAFSQSVKVLVSSGADGQLCVWSIDGWEKMKSKYIQPPSNHSGALAGDTMVQFHYDQIHLLVVHESQLAIFDWQLECLCSWFPRDALPAPISSAVYSIGCVLVYTGFRDGSIGIFKAESLTLLCRIAPSAYIPSLISSGGEAVYPMVVATHPWKPNQIAVGMSDGAVHVLMPRKKISVRRKREI